MRKTLSLLAALAAGAASAATPDQLLQGYVAEARKAEAGLAASAARGEAMFRREHAGDNGPTACATCHTGDPRKEGRTRAHKAIAPLAPAANPERFTDPAKTEKWFGRNCKDVLARTCTPAEKADFTAWLMSVR